jgi:signal transduction histidine kinase
MNAVRVWNQVRQAQSAGAAAHDAGLRRVGTRLAVQTVALLLVMLLVLEIVVYLITQHALLDTIDTTLQNRAQADSGLLRSVYGGPGGPDDHPGFFRPPDRQRGSDASVTYLGLDLKPIGSGFGPEGSTVYDVSAARSALQAGHGSCCTTRTVGGRQYRVYTALAVDGGFVLGVIQSSISLDQYNSTLRDLRGALVIVTLLGLVIAAAITLVLVRRALEPVRIAMKRQRDFVADAAHELRTPLAIMRSAAELGMGEEAAEDRQATMEQVLAQTAHLTRLVDDLSLLARADSNAVTMQQSSVDFSSLVAGVTEEIQPLAEEQGVALVTRTEGEVAVFGDIIRLRQLVLILLDNALKHTPDGGTVRVTLLPRGTRVDLRVADTGPGIDPADLPRIFDRFYRADKARAGEGTGLGLAIARWIVEAHGGTIQAGNEPGGGAVFTVTLPTMRSSTAPDARPAQQRAS